MVTLTDEQRMLVDVLDDIARAEFADDAFEHEGFPWENVRTLAEHDLTWEELVDAAVLVGTDFNEGISGVGPKTAVDFVHEHGDLPAVCEAEGCHVDGADRVRQLFLDPAVDGDVAFDTDTDPDVEAARSFVVEEWEVDPEEVRRGFERIEAALVQTGLDEWT